jgi:hypothetical protein
MMAKILSLVAIVISVLLLIVGIANINGNGSREVVFSMSIVLAGALIALAIADSRK